MSPITKQNINVITVVLSHTNCTMLSKFQDNVKCYSIVKSEFLSFVVKFGFWKTMWLHKGHHVLFRARMSFAVVSESGFWTCVENIVT